MIKLATLSLVLPAKYMLGSLDQGCNWVTVTDPDDPLTCIVMRVRPGCDPDVTWYN